jgi:hypothetical protein
VNLILRARQLESARTQGCQMVYFKTKKSKFGLIIEGLRIENVGIFYDNLQYFTAVCNILWPFGIFCGHLVNIFYGRLLHFPPCFGMLHQ